MSAEFVPRPGAVRCKDAEGDWIMANPHNTLYSTVSMAATEFWDDGEWRPIWPEDHEEDNGEVNATDNTPE